MIAKIRVGITQGDPAGVGWEVILGALADGRMGELASFTVYGSSAAADIYRKSITAEEGSTPAQWRLVDVGAVAFEPGIPTEATGESAVKALKAGVAALRKREIDVLVTAPICKENVQRPDFDFVGHTEFLAAEFGAAPVMMMVAGGLRVALVTAHMALADVPGAIARDKIVDKLRTIKKSLREDFAVVEPRIAVLSLNPHGGEGGLMGNDEAEVITPAIRQAWDEGVLAFGPVAVDGLFLSGDWSKYDAVLAMYHDQGLAPFKALAPHGVNFTAGLPVVRTSPDHGTAFDIAGKGVARADSMREAIYTAIDVFRNRAAWAEMSSNPLKHYEREKGADITVDFTKTEL